MDNRAFDSLTRSIAEITTRRSVLKSSAIAALAALSLEEVFAKKGNHRAHGEGKKKKKKHKATPECKRRVRVKGGKKGKKKNRLVNAPDGTACSGGTCQGGLCKSTGGGGGTPHTEPCDGTCAADQQCVADECCNDVGTVCNAHGAECCSESCACGMNPSAGLCRSDTFNQGFEHNLDHWFDWTGSTFGNPTVITRVASGTHGISSPNGGFHAEVATGVTYEPFEQLTAFTTWGGYSDSFPSGGYNTSIDIYLEPDTVGNNQHVDYTSAVSKTTCLYQDEGIFHFGKNGSGQFCVSAGGGANQDIDPCTADPSPVTLLQADKGWYTFVHEFREVGVFVETTMKLLKGNTVVGTWVRSTTVGVEGLGGNRYGWFPVQEFPFLAIDNCSRS